MGNARRKKRGLGHEARIQGNGVEADLTAAVDGMGVEIGDMHEQGELAAQQQHGEEQITDCLHTHDRSGERP